MAAALCARGPSRARLPDEFRHSLYMTLRSTFCSPFLMRSGDFIIVVYFSCMVSFISETIPLVNFSQICPALLKLLEASSG